MNTFAATAARARAAIGSGRIKEARELVAQLEPWARAEEERATVGMLACLVGEPPTAIRLLEGVSRHLPGVPDALALAYMNMGREADAAHIMVRHKLATIATVEDGLELETVAHAHPRQSQRYYEGAPPLDEIVRWLFGGGLEAMCDTLGPTQLGAPAIRTRTKMLPRWKGEHVKELVVFFLSGFGDAHMCVRYVAPLLRRFHVTAIAHPVLHSLLAHCLPGSTVVSFEECADALARADAYTETALLPFRMRDVRTEAVCIAPERERVERWALPSDRLNVGVVWNGSEFNGNDEQRSIPVAMLDPLFTVPGIAWHSLQVGSRAGECPPGVTNHSARLTDFHESAALIANLDLVIAIDSSIANLAGAMGKPVWVMVETVGNNDFRWGTEGETTPWFPSARVFRQSKRGEWGDVVARVRDALKKKPALFGPVFGRAGD